MSVPTDYAVVEAMKVYGGSFVKALAVLAERADLQNLAKIKGAWAEYWTEYADIAKVRYERGDGPA